MTNVYQRNMLGVLFLLSLMVVAIASPVFAEEGVMTATNAVTATVTSEATKIAVVTFSKEDLVALKAALDGLQGVIVALDAYVAKLPKESNERALIAREMNATLSSMSVNLVALNGTLASANQTPVRNLVELNSAPIVIKKNVSEVSPFSNLEKKGSAMVPEKNVVKEEMVASEKITNETSADKGLLSSLKSSLNSPPGVIVLIVFAMIFGVVVFMRVSGGKEAQTT